MKSPKKCTKECWKSNRKECWRKEFKKPKKNKMKNPKPKLSLRKLKKNWSLWEKKWWKRGQWLRRSIRLQKLSRIMKNSRNIQRLNWCRDWLQAPRLKSTKKKCLNLLPKTMKICQKLKRRKRSRGRKRNRFKDYKYREILISREEKWT